MKVACVYDGQWVNIDTGEPTSGPKKDEVCQVVWSTQDKKRWNRTFIMLKGWEQCGVYPLSCFRPIVDDFGDRVCKEIELSVVEKVTIQYSNKDCN